MEEKEIIKLPTLPDTEAIRVEFLVSKRFGIFEQLHCCENGWSFDLAIDFETREEAINYIITNKKVSVVVMPFEKISYMPTPVEKQDYENLPF